MKNTIYLMVCIFLIFNLHLLTARHCLGFLGWFFLIFVLLTLSFSPKVVLQNFGSTCCNAIV